MNEQDKQTLYAVIDELTNYALDFATSTQAIGIESLQKVAYRILEGVTDGD